MNTNEQIANNIQNKPETDKMDTTLENRIEFTMDHMCILGISASLVSLILIQN